jgi:hypothetical protein
MEGMDVFKGWNFESIGINIFVYTKNFPENITSKWEKINFRSHTALMP